MLNRSPIGSRLDCDDSRTSTSTSTMIATNDCSSGNGGSSKIFSHEITIYILNNNNNNNNISNISA